MIAALARDKSRLVEIARIGLDLEADRPYLQAVADTVAARLGTPFAMIDVLLNDAQIFLAGHGPVPPWLAESGGTPLEWAFCQPLLAERAARQVTDLSEDPMFRDNPLVTVAGVRAYAGAPLISSGGHVVGGLCGLDMMPRRFEPADLTFLQEVADQTVARLEEYAEG